MKHKIDEQIAQLDMVALRNAVDTGKIDPRPYQWLCYAMTGNAIRNYKGPAFITASVGAGKTIMIAMVAARFSQMGYEGMIIARQGEIIDQDAEELWNLNVKNSLFSASLGRKSTAYPVIVGSEGTVINALFSTEEKPAALGDFTPRFLLVDECLTGDALIEVHGGDKVRIDNPDLNLMKIKCMDEDSGKYHYHKPVRVFTNGTRCISSIRLKSGEEIKCTDTHRLLSNGCWVRAGELKSGQSLTLSASQDGFMKKLRRAVVAVAIKLFHMLSKAHLHH